MAITVKCQKCGNIIEVSQALQHQIQEEVLDAEREKNKILIERAKKEAEESAIRRVKEDFDLSIKKSQQDANEEKERNKKLTEQILSLTKEIRESRRALDDSKLESAKKFADEEVRIREEVRKKADEEHSLKDREVNLQLQKALELNEELQRKLKQGSQQSQGESLELEVEEILRKEFPGDIITEVAKGVRGADTLQRVIDKHNRDCGSILWESKNAKWSGAWISKLKEDQRNAKAQMGVLVSVDMPADIKNFTFRDGVWITSRSTVVGLAWALRINIDTVQKTVT